MALGLCELEAVEEALREGDGLLEGEGVLVRVVRDTETFAEALMEAEPEDFPPSPDADP